MKNLILALVALAALSTMPASAADEFEWTCTARWSATHTGYWFTEEPGGTVSVHELKRDCGGSGFARPLCWLSAGDRVAVATSVPGSSTEFRRFKWNDAAFVIAHPRDRRYEFSGQASDGTRYDCRLVSDASAIPKPNCGCYGSDRGTEACQGRGPRSCK